MAQEMEPLHRPRLLDVQAEKGCFVEERPTSPVVPIDLYITVTNEERENLLEKLARPISAPRLTVDANAYRTRLDKETKKAFQQSLLQALRAGWKSEQTEASFLRLVDIFESCGCAIFSGLIGDSNFARLIQRYT